KRMNVCHLIGIATVIGLSMPVFADGPRLDGNWEVYMEMQVEGSSSDTGGGTRIMTTHCVTKKAATDPMKLLPESNAQDCKISNYKVAGNTVTWNMACEGAQPMTSAVEFVYDGDTYKGKMKMNTTRSGLPATVNMTYEGKRMGDCKE